MKTVVLYTAALSASLLYLVTGQTCYFNLQDHIEPHKEPLVLEYESNKQLKVAFPQVSNNKGVIPLGPGSELVLACSGQANRLAWFTGVVDTAVVRCDIGGQLIIEAGGTKYNASKSTTSCVTKSQPTFTQTARTCGRGDVHSGVILEIAFEVQNQHLPVIDICYNVAKRSTLYSSHIIHGASLGGQIIPRFRPKFKKGLNWKINPDQLYNPRAERITVNLILGLSSNDSRYIGLGLGSRFLARGHLAPDADFIYSTGRFGTYYYENAAPQWQGFNAGNWATIENAVRDLAMKLGADLEVWTGNFQSLELLNVNNSLMEIYLNPQENSLPAPQVYWKLVRDPNQKTCTAVVGHNNVYLSQSPSSLCLTTPTPKGWPDDLTDLSKGYTYYCDYSSFVDKIKTAPYPVYCNGQLVFP